jgi:CheY-like chemotaxis protein/pSer/pThr/pTyr-binding forkhead associated (FHA) protein
MPVLRIKLPENKGEIAHVLAGERITIGRRPDNTIQIIDRTVSGHHAELISINGHYRLHDLGSTNLTCVDGQPVSDFHLHDLCKVSFGTVECEFTPETPVTNTDKSEVVPTRAELEFLRRENLDLQAKISGMQKQIDILSSARLMTKETQNLGVLPEVHKRVTQERDELRTQNANLQNDLEHLRADVASLARERDALRLAWETVKRDGVAAEAAAASLSAASAPAPAAPSAPAPATSPGVFVPPPPAVSEDPSMGTVLAAPPIGALPKLPPSAVDSLEHTRVAGDHRAMASVLMSAPSCLKNMQVALDQLAIDGTNDEAAAALSTHTLALAQTVAPLTGHPAQHLATACAALVKDSRTRAGRIEPSVVTTLKQASETITALLDPRALKKVKAPLSPRTLIVDDDQNVVETLDRSLKSAHFQSSSCATAEQALDLLQRERFDLVLLDISMPGLSGFDLCAKIRETTTNKKTPVIFMTGADSVENRAQSSITGGDDFLTKPLNMFELGVKASSWVCRSQLELKN